MESIVMSMTDSRKPPIAVPVCVCLSSRFSPPKTNMEPENAGFQNLGASFQNPWNHFRGRIMEDHVCVGLLAQSENINKKTSAQKMIETNGCATPKNRGI